ncbi:uncharacterized protein BP5553_01779 [Venustampulla echinocandica]|uniref:Uncharacterized protein n=1 Tax=Venustampulla echinocandica TaxID=2656787 RepID=A0A370U1Y9_9HELO|nr:uncharacterized protein BP5553_01779 [Venustampulla echinocandica]RDL41800.1 hypothetical protein BP5553_01779 [Venustampulla echinocandica]
MDNIDVSNPAKQSNPSLASTPSFSQLPRRFLRKLSSVQILQKTSLKAVAGTSKPNPRQHQQYTVSSPPPLPSGPISLQNPMRYEFSKNKPLPFIPITESEGSTSSPDTMGPTRIPKSIGTKGCGHDDTVHPVTPRLLTPKMGEKEHTMPVPVRPVDPLPNRAGRQITNLPRSRTMGMLSNLTSTFSLSNMSSSCSKGHDCLPSIIQPTSSTPSSIRLPKVKAFASTNNLIPLTTAVASITTPTALAGTSCEPSLAATTPRNPNEHHQAMPPSYWAGRLQGIHDRLGNEMLQETIDNFRDKVSLTAPKCLQEELDNRYRQAFKELQELCITKEAKKSLYDFQQAYARRLNMPLLLHIGGHMKDGWKVKKEAQKGGSKRSSNECSQASLQRLSKAWK